MPLTNKVAEEIVAFSSELRLQFDQKVERSKRMAWIAARLECGNPNAEIIDKMYQAQNDVSEIPTEIENPDIVENLVVIIMSKILC